MNDTSSAVQNKLFEEFFRRWYWEDFDSGIREKVLEAVLLRDEAF